MHRPRPKLNIPTEIMRSIISISETGSLTKSAALLGLSQPAVSAQIKRIESLVGGSIFQKTPNGSATTELGKLVIKQARKIIEANDQLLILRDASSPQRALRIGVTSLYSGRLLSCLGKVPQTSASVYSDISPEIVKGLANGYVDMALLYWHADVPIEAPFEVVLECDQPAVWARSRDFVLSPGAPIPLVSWPGLVSHDVVINALERAGLIYRLAFTSPDMHVSIEAAAAGTGLIALPADAVPSSLVIATEYYLPALAKPRKLLVVRPGLQLESRDLIAALASEFFRTS